MFKLFPWFPTVILCFCLVAFISRADTDEIPDGPLEGLGATDEVFSPPGLSGDWGGQRTWLSERGLEFSADLTNTLQGVMDGGFDETARYVGSSELMLDADAEKLGLWPGGFARVAAEGRFGKDVVVKAGTFSPVNNDALFPSDPDREGDDVFAITEMNATQFLAPWFGIFGGLLNTTSGDANDFAGFARSNEHFQNLSFLASTVSLLLVPSVTLGGGFVVIPFEGLAVAAMFMETEESAGSNPFDTGSGWTFVNEWTLDHDVLDMPVRHVFSFGLGFDEDFSKLELPRLEFPPGGPPSLSFASKDESWAIWYNGQLTFWTHDDDAERQAGFFFRFGYADDETNPVEWNIAGGIGGVGLLDFRPKDRFGIGVYHIEPSDGFPLPAIGIGEETGFEMFYSVHLLQGLTITADLQFIDSGLGSGPLVSEKPDDAWAGGLRLRLVL
ncbi:MAG: carbohydrate porin [Deltaproteobacteria bacterium]|nr:carbohydrate porin [Deltaproteobacteria bacterium]